MSWFIFSSVSTAATLPETQRSLDQLNHKIATLKNDVIETKTQSTKFNQDLSRTEYLIKNLEISIQTIQQKITLKKRNIIKIEQKIVECQLNYTHLQKILAQQLKVIYTQQPNQALAWFLTHPQTPEMGKLFAYNHYVLQAHHITLQQLKHSQFTLQQQQLELQHEIEECHKIQAKSQITQQQLLFQKKHYQSLLVAIHEHLANQERTMSRYERNRDNLSLIIGKLSRESVVQTRHSMTSMKHRLPNPVSVEPSHIEKMHHGVMFYSPEGNAVQAVYPGKIVFGEWLNGYGLLIIIDHGWGLMTLYANNHSLTTHVGDIVSQGEQIATVGRGEMSKQAGLYFELRKHGRAISPLEWLTLKKS